MLNVRRMALAAGLIAALGIPMALAAGLWSTLPMVGSASYCASNVTGATSQICAQTVPAGPATFTGNEYVPADTTTLGATGQSLTPATVAVSLPQLGQGAQVDLTTVGTANTIPPTTPWYFLDGAQGGALTVTMPAAPLQGAIQHIFCTAATVGTVTVAANAGQSIKNAPAVAACTAGTGWAWVYNAPNTTWYRYQ